MGAFLDATIVAALIAGAFAGIGYLANQNSQRMERRGQIFADALRCIRVYQELPYEVWRRDDDGPSTKARLREAAGRAYHDVYYHLQRLQIEAPTAALAYRDLFEQTRRQDRLNRPIAWGSRIGDSKLKPWETPTFRGDNGPETDLCVEAMRAELSIFRLLRRPAIRRRLVEQRNKRATVPQSVEARQSSATA
jgi:hypothetical protein